MPWAEERLSMKEISLRFTGWQTFYELFSSTSFLFFGMLNLRGKWRGKTAEKHQKALGKMPLKMHLHLQLRPKLFCRFKRRNYCRQAHNALCTIYSKVQPYIVYVCSHCPLPFPREKGKIHPSFQFEFPFRGLSRAKWKTVSCIGRRRLETSSEIGC